MAKARGQSGSSVFASTGKSIVASKKDSSPSVSKSHSPEPGAEPSVIASTAAERTKASKLLRQFSNQHCVDAPAKRASQISMDRDSLVAELRADAEANLKKETALLAAQQEPEKASAWRRSSRRRSSLIVLQALTGSKSAPATRPASPLRDLHAVPATTNGSPADSGSNSPMRRKMLPRSTQVMQRSIDRLRQNPPKQHGWLTDRSWAEHLSQLSARSFPSQDVPLALRELENGEILASLMRQGLILSQENRPLVESPHTQPHGPLSHQKHSHGASSSGAQTERNSTRCSQL